jgi:glutamate-1-semialdehyde aminotransferase
MATAETARSLAKSQILYSRARRVILGGTQTLSKQPERYDAERFPAYIERGCGCRLRDVDGNEYVDFVLALGPVVLGYCHPAVDAAVRAQLEKGVIFSGNSPLEVELAETLVRIIPCAEMVRFFKTGAEATAAAVRLARNFTGRELVVSAGYNGWHDWWAAKNNEPGVPAALRRLTLDLPYGDIERCRAIFERHGAEVACLILEPVATAFAPEFVEQAAAVARTHGALVIFDEIITGFRVALGGMQQRLGITPDLATFGKAMANGFPISVVAGRGDVFRAAERCWISSTFGGEALSLAAALATISELEAGAIEHLGRLAGMLACGWQTLLQQFPAVRAEVRGCEALPVLFFPAEARRQEDIFTRSMLEQGFLVRRNHYWFTTASHTENDIREALEACANAFRRIEADL